jgi:hypothetical protein
MLSNRRNVFYIDGINTSSLKIAGSLKGRAETTFQ